MKRKGGTRYAVVIRRDDFTWIHPRRVFASKRRAMKEQRRQQRRHRSWGYSVHVRQES